MCLTTTSFFTNITWRCVKKYAKERKTILLDCLQVDISEQETISETIPTWLAAILQRQEESEKRQEEAHTKKFSNFLQEVQEIRELSTANNSQSNNVTEDSNSNAISEMKSA